ncbi:hypothetical protein O3P69_003396 [Scylla paramamosain]|uniref:Uncharacterized protein n=1 Tax=Scylla paramamosain TaxID=85552 RepID=A0AAW0UIA0_SCYPA
MLYRSRKLWPPYRHPEHSSLKTFSGTLSSKSPLELPKSRTFLIFPNLLSLWSCFAAKHWPSFQGEVNRYITWPGQACAYKVGEIKIKELRQKAQNALGSLFRLSDFHDVLLGCIGPLKIVEECVASYIEQTNLEIEKGGEEKGEEEESEGGDKDEHESSDPREQGVDSESVASEDAAGGRSSVAGSSVLVLVACWLATLRAAHYR